MAHILAAGTTAPNFTLRETPDQNLSLSELKGKPVILAFYPADWSPVCGDHRRSSMGRFSQRFVTTSLAACAAA